MSSIDLPYKPVRGQLYSSRELLQGFEPDDPQSAAATLDLRTYRYYVMEGKSFPPDAVAGMMEALADNSIAQAMFRFLQQQPKVAAIMGGHGVSRADQVYRDVVAIAKQLAEADFMVATGGGPGVMEAAHLGALLRGRTDREVTDALTLLESVADLPKTKDVVRADGSTNDDMVAAIHKWMVPAWQIQRDVADPGPSLAVPTWYYGSEPLTPLATHVAKFFQNSIREDILLMLAAQGIIYANGRAGTIQEVFQDAAQNYYAETEEEFCPMVFYASDGFWTQQLPVRNVLEPLFSMGRWKHKYDDFVSFVQTPHEAASFIIDRSAPVEKRLGRMEALGMTALMTSATNTTI